MLERVAWLPGRAPRAGAAGLALLLVLAAPAASGQERVEGDLYANDRYGIQISKPPRWQFITAGTILDLAKKSGRAGGLKGDEDPVKVAGFAVIVSKTAVLGPEVTPQVVVLVHEVSKPPESLVKVCEGLRSGMTEPEALAPTREIRLGGRPAARLDFQGIVGGAMVRATALCTFRERQAFVVVGQAPAAEFQGELATFESILASFRLR